MTSDSKRADRLMTMISSIWSQFWDLPASRVGESTEGEWPTSGQYGRAPVRGSKRYHLGAIFKVREYGLMVLGFESSSVKITEITQILSWHPRSCV